MDWYRVVKTIRGRRYLYWQKTYRVGRCVKTLNKYIGPASPAASPVHADASASGVFPDTVKYAIGRSLEPKHPDYSKRAPLKVSHDAEYNRINQLPACPDKVAETKSFYAGVSEEYNGLQNRIRSECFSLAEEQLKSARYSPKTAVIPPPPVETFREIVERKRGPDPLPKRAAHKRFDRIEALQRKLISLRQAGRISEVTFNKRLGILSRQRSGAFSEKENADAKEVHRRDRFAGRKE